MPLIARFRITFAYLLLIVFSLAALPKELWHHCEYPSVNSIQNENSKQAHVSINQEECSVCAIQMAPFISPPNWEIHVEVLTFDLQMLSLYVGQEFTSSASISLRGPPLG